MPNGDGVTSMIRSEKAVTSIFLADSLYCLPTLHAFIRQAARWERPCGKKLQAASGQQPVKNSVLAATTGEFGNGCFPTRAFR